MKRRRTISNHWKTALLLFPIIGTFSAAAGTATIDWPAFLARQDPVWTAMPDRWESGAFVGNGLVGAMVYGDGTNGLAWELGRSDVVDTRKGDGNPLVTRARLPIGSFRLVTAGRITNGTARIDLWNAEAGGTVQTERGAVAWRTFAHAEDEVLLIELAPAGGEQEASLVFAPAVSETSRPAKKGRPKDYQPNPPPTRRADDGVEVCVQPLLEGGGYATAWQEQRRDGRMRVLVGVGYDPAGECARAAAVSNVLAAARADETAWTARHRAWWRAYWPRSFLSIPDAKLESFYWIQLYKLGSATRADRPALDLMGPWYHRTLWPGIWWNLNIQAAYHPVYVANRLDLGESLCRMLDDAAETLVSNTLHYAQWDFDGRAATIARVTSYDCGAGMWKGQNGCPEVGNLPWACQLYWRQCRYAGDDARMRDRLVPLLKRAMNFYLTIMERHDDGTLHLPCTYSPELWYAPDCNYDLASFRWGLETLVAESARLNLDEPDLPRWREVLAKLTPFPADTNGYMVGRDVPFAKLHRHYSHLLMFHPYHVVHLDQPENRALIRTSVDHWSRNRGAFAGYSYAAAASMFAEMGRGDEAVTVLHEFVKRQVHPNTMYTEAESPCIESPLAAAQSLHDLLLQSWGGRIHVFTGTPAAWSDAVFADLRSEGAFLVSAERRNGATSWIRVKSPAGGRCIVRHDLKGEVACTTPMKRLANGDLELDLPRGTEALLYAGDRPPAIAPAPLPHAPAEANPFGLKRAP